jgi:NAD+ synthase (glutamine-hydrolysing)
MTMDLLGLPRTNIKARSLRGFATSERTATNSGRLTAALGVEASEIDIRPGCMQMLRDIGHPFAEGTPLYDVAFENVQAGQRTSLLFRLANREAALVVGTGDLSELALGWCTYGVGDHMSHYNVNAGLPKTLIQYILRWAASGDVLGQAVSPVLEDILGTEISPELVPGEGNRQPAQSTEAVVGPYELQDFNLYYITRYGYLPSKVAFLAWCAWRDPETGRWPDILPDKKHGYTLSEIKKWLAVFLHRFFKISQFKRSCVPNAPKVGSGGSLSPRGDYRAPSDGEEAPWMEDLENIPEEDS